MEVDAFGSIFCNCVGPIAVFSCIFVGFLEHEFLDFVEFLGRDVLGEFLEAVDLQGNALFVFVGVKAEHCLNEGHVGIVVAH